MNKTFLTLSVLTLAAAAFTAPARADDAMAGMDMGGMKTAAKPAAAPLTVTATVNPAAPQAGDNTLALTVLDAAGKPATGLKLTANVAMTSMDMGTTRPTFIETAAGQYTAKVNFSMNGPWRVVVRSGTAKVAVLNFEAGAKAPWKPPTVKAAVAAPVKADAPAAGPMPGMDMSAPAPTPAAPAPVPAAAAPSMGDMKMGGMTGMTGIGDMKTAPMPELKETGTYTATGDEDWAKQTGFGHNAGMVAMMNQMMVGGSGMEGMKMPAMTMKFDEQNYAKPSADDADDMAGMDMGGKAADKKAGAGGGMAGMDMGGKDKGGDMGGMKMDAPPAAPKPNAPTADIKAMPGMNMDAAPKPGAAPAAPAPAKVTATMAAAPKSGNNLLTISVTDAQGKAITGAAITTSVAMTSMDMGTTHPPVTEKGVGQYAATVNFSMAGPWRVKVKVAAPGQKAQTKAFDFTAK